jgi:hypothetical protein
MRALMKTSVGYCLIGGGVNEDVGEGVNGCR